MTRPLLASLCLVHTLSLAAPSLTAAPADDVTRAVLNFRDDKPNAHDEVVALGEAAVPGLAGVLADRKLNATTRLSAANALGDIHSPAAVKPLVTALRDDDFNVRRCAALALGKIGDPAAKQPLQRLATSDPFAWRDPETGKTRYLVREDARTALDQLASGTPAAAAVPGSEQFLDDASQLPPSPVKVPAKHLPWPFPGTFADQHLFNNYQQPTDTYIHAGLDLLQSPGSDVRAVDDGVVAAIATNYPEWTTHHFFIVTPEPGGAEGWCYTHVDPASYTFKVGDRIRRGQVLGKVVDFYVGKNKGADHLHLNYVRFTKSGDKKVDIQSLADPLQFFDWTDTAAPVIDDVFHFVREGTLTEFPSAADDGVPTVRGPVDIIVGISDTPGPDIGCNWMVPVVTLEIAGNGTKPLRKLVLDQRGAILDPNRSAVLYVSWDDKQHWLAGRPPFPFVQFLKITNTDGDGTIEPADAAQTWDTRQIPDGLYEVTVRAWDLKGNTTAKTAKVRVANSGNAPR